MRIKNIFDFFKRNKQTTQTPSEHLVKIPWSEVVKECYDKGLSYTSPVVKVIYADDKTQRAVILQRSDATYTTSYEKLYAFDDEELKYTTNGLHGAWYPGETAAGHIFDTEEHAINAVFSDPPFKYNRSIVWADFPFRIDVETLCWVKKDGVDDPADFCLHGHAVAKIGGEFFEYDATVSATGLYLLRTLTENHIAHECEHILPCCGHWMLANVDLSSVDIGGCTNGIDWSVIHENDKVKIITEAGNEVRIDMDDYKKEVYAFADKIEDFYNKCSPKNLAGADSFSRNGYISFWNEWHRRRL